MQHTTSTDFIPAAPHAIGKAFWGRWFERSVRSHFHRGIVRGAEHVAPWSINAPRRMTTPLILYGTHGSWWDAALSIVLSLRVLDLRAYGMMEYRQLRRYPFFKSIGMFSVVREDPRSAVRSLDYAAITLRGTGNALWMFPQGTLIHQDVRPVTCEPGIAMLARKLGDVWLCPVAFRYELLREQRPECRVLIGEPHRITWNDRSDHRTVANDCTRRLTAIADEAKHDAMLERTDGYDVFCRGRTSIEKRFDTLLGRR